MQLVWPAEAYLEGLRDALLRGWSPDNLRGEDAAREELAKIDADPVAYVAAQVDREARGDPITMPDGQQMPRLPVIVANGGILVEHFRKLPLHGCAPSVRYRIAIA